ncbi:alpha-N-acetylgalactosaminide alpha-2,6-sialyltransferase 6 [Cyprinodon tularosa]|uniref:alpha-N-acetylgalactosaminide alpha-2,6-sialyltransferase 6 n=1 Tax=Cyprinodon tularosa TaxID=77115 RepID=UPI0018E1DA6B|nr:alpha-N-acetylgalactosaminide alpha-2,6-sialyltransferase 6 [Cyprinodon tularosa]XP_038164621.1 alpha-N-acetylgalactosaminide alpha-2,6-sialyltransferase 6 [Cyprinodon tularosa]
MVLRINGKGQQSHRLVIFFAVFILTTLLILYGSNNSNDGSYIPFNIALIRATKTTDLKKWSGRDGYMPLYGSKSMTLHCHNCALVTSSSHVLGSQAGSEVDQTECVIRMNDAPTSGYESDVGNRTTVRVVAHASVFRVIKRPNEYLQRTDSNSTIIFWGPPNKIGKDAKGTLFRLLQRVSMTYSNLSFFSISPNKMRKFDNLFTRETGRDRQKSHSWLSTGWFTMVIAIEMCDNIKVYGMVPPNYCGKKTASKKMPYHYYKPRGSDECLMYIQNESGRRGNHHRFITEKQVFARWAKQYNITFTNPKW